MGLRERGTAKARDCESEGVLAAAEQLQQALATQASEREEGSAQPRDCAREGLLAAPQQALRHRATRESAPASQREGVSEFVRECESEASIS